MKNMKRVAIFCGSSFGNDEIYLSESIKAASLLAQNGYDLVYGGGYKGLMGKIAETFIDNEARVYGVLPEIFNIPSVLSKNVHTELIITKTMHERKETMYRMADAYLIFPGGIGTFEEFFEIYTWKQLLLHDKNIILYNISSFYDVMLKFLDESTDKGFISEEVRDSLLVASSPDQLLKMISQEKITLSSKV